MLFPFSIEGAARIWLEKEPPRSIQTWDDLVSKFINQFFPPSKTTNLRNEITRFQQRFDESFYEAWDRFNDLLRACPHHGFSELHQLDTFYNALNINDQDSLNSAAGGNFLDKMPRECLKIIESKSKVRQTRAKAVVAKVSTNSSTQAVSSDVAELKDIVRALLLDKKNQASTPAPAPAPVKSSLAKYVSQAAAANYNQVSSNFRPQMVANHIRPPGFPPVQNSQANNANNFNRGNNFNQNRESNFNQNRGGNFNQSNFSQNQLHRPQVLSPLFATVVAANTVPNTKPSVSLPYPSRRDNEKSRMDECLALADLGASINPKAIFQSGKSFQLPDLTPRDVCTAMKLLRFSRACPQWTHRGHHGANLTAKESFDSGFICPPCYKDAHTSLSSNCDSANVNEKLTNGMICLKTPSKFCEIFDNWGIDFKGPFPVFH
ncbi:reverse transcriptase domain-containing protein [Tanacetum coccineum]